jgi:hypothetical protein
MMAAPAETSARRLRRRTFTITGVIPDITYPFYPDFERAFCT